MITKQRGLKMTKKFNEYIDEIDNLMNEKDRQDDLYTHMASLDFDQFKQGEKHVTSLLTKARRQNGNVQNEFKGS